MSENVLLLGGNGDTQVFLHAGMANRHGLVTGATGTGKTVTLQVLAEGFSRLGVPVFTADIKGDLSAVAAAGSASSRLQERWERIGAPTQPFEASPVQFWDVFGAQGTPVRTTVAEMGPVLLSNLLELNDVQEGVLQVAFRVADDEGLLLLDLKDLRAMLNWVGDNAAGLERRYGRVAKTSVAAILRRLLVLEQAGAEQYFGEPALKITDLLRRDPAGRGIVNVLDATRLYQSPRIYSTFLLWLLSELLEHLPERGDTPLPELVFFFDEAHLLFSQSPPALRERIAQLVRLIRSKGVGIFFVTQYPRDIPDDVLGQLGNRVQHALRAFTPSDQKALRAAADTFRANAGFNTARAIAELAVGEALVSTLEPNGVPASVERVWIMPPRSQFGPITDGARHELLHRSPLHAQYCHALDRESAYERLEQREREVMQSKSAVTDAARKPARAGAQRQGVGEALLKSVVRSVGSALGRSIARGLMGSFRR